MQLFRENLVTEDDILKLTRVARRALFTKNGVKLLRRKILECIEFNAKIEAKHWLYFLAHPTWFEYFIDNLKTESLTMLFTSEALNAMYKGDVPVRLLFEYKDMMDEFVQIVFNPENLVAIKRRRITIHELLEPPSVQHDK